MRILLVGEYSRFHNSLKKGLIAQGHDVTLVGDGDQYKDFPVDISTKPKLFSSTFILRKFKNLIYTLFRVDLLLIEQGLRYRLIKNKLKGYDVVQLINSDALFTYPWIARPVLAYLFKNNAKVILSACGDDTPYVDWLLNNSREYDLFYPMKHDGVDKSQYQFSLKYTKESYRKQYAFIEKSVSAIIPTDMDYYIPLKTHPKVSTLIPTPVTISEFSTTKLPSLDTIHIFHGISNINYIKKGNRYFEDALAIIKQEYGDTIKITTARSLPYKEYIKAYDSAHILLDQVFSYDQAYNALEAMAKGKVVFSGAETEFYEFYNLKETVCINAIPDVNDIVEKLKYLIDNPSEIVALSERARAFVKKHHNPEGVTKSYLDIYNA